MVNANNQQYHNDQGVYYVQVDNGYKAVPAPVGAKVTTLPKNSVEVTVNSEQYFYYGGTFCEPEPGQ